MEESKRKKPKSNISPTLRTAIWDRYMGPGIKKALCHLCGCREIALNANNGFECAHIVAETYESELSIFYLYPSCAVCNSECRTQTLFDYLYARQRLKVLRKLIWKIYTTFEDHHPDEMIQIEYQAWKLLDHLYGPRKYKLGGGIVNRRQIYEIARSVQAQHLVEDMKKLHVQLEEVTKKHRAVCDSVILVGSEFV